MAGGLVVLTTHTLYPQKLVLSFQQTGDARSQLLGSDRVPGLNPSHAEVNGSLNEAVRQIALADLVIVNKVDLVSPEHVEQLKKEIRSSIASLVLTDSSQLTSDSQHLGERSRNLTSLLALPSLSARLTKIGSAKNRASDTWRENNRVVQLSAPVGQHTRSRCPMYPEKMGGDRPPPSLLRPLKPSLAVCSVASFSSAIVGFHCVRRLHRHSPAMTTCVFSLSLM
uniref:(California timema) hypothetical protein n=1 Tax=Timema californicum TaxID=61474 RepID=A0A7R9IXE2_TIMCA|nr:unnamed protein product [Timema californicum]